MVFERKGLLRKEGSMQNRIFILVLTLLLSACGGGGADNPTSPPSGTPTTPILTNKTQAAAKAVLQSAASVRSVVDEARNILRNPGLWPIGTAVSCNGSGFLNISFVRDSDGILNVGDEIRIDYSNCFTSSLFTATGSLTIDIIDLNKRSARAVVEFGRLDVDFFVAVEGEVEAFFQFDDTNETVEIEITAPTIVYENGELQSEIKSGRIERFEDFVSATYSESHTLSIFDVSVGSEREFETQQITPWSGYFYQGPTSGQVNLNGPEDRRLTLRAATGPEISVIETVQSNGTLQVDMDQIYAESLWSAKNTMKRFGDFRNDIFLGSNTFATFATNFGLSEPIEIIFNRPVASVNESDLELRGELTGVDGRGFTTKISGSVFTIHADNAYEPTNLYSIYPGIQVESDSGLVLDYFDLPAFETREDIKPRLSGLPSVYGDNDTPLMDASDSQSQFPLSFEWFELSDVGISFDLPNAASTSITIPSSAIGDLRIALKMTDQRGYSVTKSVILRDRKEASTFHAFYSRKVFSLGDGNNSLFFDTDAAFSLFPSATNESVVVNIDPLVFADPGRAEFIMNPGDGQTLTRGTYQVSLDSETDSNLPGMSALIDNLICPNSIGHFEILDIQRSNEVITSLAMDYQVSCAADVPFINGAVRINSDVTVH